MSFLLWFPLRGNRMDLFWNFWVYISKKKNICDWFLFFISLLLLFFFFVINLQEIRCIPFDEISSSMKPECQIGIFESMAGVYEGAYVYNKSCRRFLSFTLFHLPLVVDRFWSQLSINRLNVSRKKITDPRNSPRFISLKMIDSFRR